jgi:hypothetical protein
MKLETGKEMDRKCVLDWLNKVYISPSFSYGEYTDEEIRIFAHDTLVLLKEQEPTIIKPHYIDKYGKHFICGIECGSCYKEISSTYHYCPYCGRTLKWE